MSYIQIHFDSQRNRLMRMSLVVSLGAVSTAATATGASLFGMNLTSGFEAHPLAFYVVSGSLLSLGAVVFGGSFFVYRKSKRLDVDLTKTLGRHHHRH